MYPEDAVNTMQDTHEREISTGARGFNAVGSNVSYQHTAPSCRPCAGDESASAARVKTAAISKRRIMTFIAYPESSLQDQPMTGKSEFKSQRRSS